MNYYLTSHTFDCKFHYFVNNMVMTCQNAWRGIAGHISIDGHILKMHTRQHTASKQAEPIASKTKNKGIAG